MLIVIIFNITILIITIIIVILTSRLYSTNPGLIAYPLGLPVESTSINTMVYVILDTSFFLLYMIQDVIVLTYRRDRHDNYIQLSLYRYGFALKVPVLCMGK